MARKSDLTRRIQIFIEGSEATKSLEQMKSELTELEEKLIALDPAEKNFDKRSKELKASIDSQNKSIETYKKKIEETNRVLNNLSGATYEELLAVHRNLQNELRKTVPGTEQYTRVLEQNTRVSKLMAKVQKDMRTEVGCQATAFGRAAAFVNKYAMLLSGALAATTGLTMTVRKVVDDYAKMEEAMADVKKYTGMADEGVKALNEDLKNMDTRTSRERLNALAADAGRLGIQSRDAILEFVDAADKINVALGEDLGEDAVKDIGKLAQMFGESDRLGLRGAMLATGSAVNELAQNSSASEPYIVGFTARLAGVGNQANISQANIMGYASALDQNMQQMETSATVFSQLITKMFQQPARFAELAGMQVKEFSDLLSKDANEALLRLLSTMQAKGGFDALAPMFEEMKLNGTRAIGVLSSVATHIDQVRDAQALANKAYNEGTSVVNEFNVKNNTVQAQLEKAKKGFLEVSIALGEKLLPVSSHMITSGSAMVRLLSSLVTFSHDYFTTILSLASAYGVYTVAVNKAIVADKLKVFWNNSVIASFKNLKAVLRDNPWGLLVLAGSALIGLLIDLKRKQDAITEAQQAMNRVNKKTAEEFDEQSFKLNLLTSQVRNNTNTIDDRRKAIEEIKKIVPDYNAMIDEEGRLISENTTALDSYLRNLEKEIKLKAAREELEDQYRKKRKLERQLGEENEALRSASVQLNTARSAAMITYGQASTAGAKNLLGGLDAGVKNAEGKFNSATVAVEKTNAALKETAEAISVLEEEIRSSSINTLVTDAAEDDGSGGGGGGDGGTGDSGDDKARKKRLEMLKTEYTAQQAEIKKIYAEGKDAELQTEEQYNLKLLAAKKDYLLKVKEAAGEGTKEYADAENQLADIQLQERKDALQHSIDMENALYASQQQMLQDRYISGMDERVDSEQEYNELMEGLQLDHLERMLKIVGLDAEKRKEIEQQVRDFKVKCINAQLKAQKEANDKDTKDAEEKKEKLEQIADNQRRTLEGYARSVGETVGRVLAGQEDALEAFTETVVDVVFDMLEKVIEAEIVAATARAVSAEAKATAESFATPDSVLTFGATGVARAAILSALIMGALAAAKGALKGLIGGKKGSSSAGDTQNSPKVYTRVPQYAAGRYPVIGEQDGRLYNAPFIGDAPTGIVRSPALIAENGSELIINSEDLMRLQRHINYPLVLQAIAESRRPQPVVQHAEGSYPSDTAPVGPSAAGGSQVLQRLAQVLEVMQRNGVKAPVVLSELEKKQQLQAAARKIGSK